MEIPPAPYVAEATEVVGGDVTNDKSAPKIPVYVLVSWFGENFRVLNISHNLEALTRQMKKIAVEAICDEIGKNNFVDTLDSPEFKNKPETECPAGFVIKYGQQSESAVRVLNVSKNTQYTSMFLRKYINNTPIGKYMIVESGDCDIKLSSAKTSAITTAESMPTVVRHAHNDLMIELAKKLTERRSKMEKEKNNLSRAQEFAIDINGDDSILVVNNEGVSFVDPSGNSTEVLDVGGESNAEPNLFVCSSATDATCIGQKNASLEYISCDAGDIANDDTSSETPLINF